jgi:O-antigen/teichoic acid export membrane protein
MERASEAAAANSEEAPAVAAPSFAFGKRLAAGAIVETGGFALSQIIRLGANLVFARLLFPAAFGLTAMLSLVLTGLGMLTDVGITQAVIRSDRGDEPAFLDTAWTIQVMRGVLLWVISCALAWPMAVVFREPILVRMIPVGALGVLIHSFASIRNLSLRRHVRPLPLVLLDLGTQVAGVLVMIGLALAGFGVWSLVWGSVATWTLYTAGSFGLPGTHRERLRIEPAARREISEFGRWIFGSSAMTFVAGRGDQFIVGRLLGAANLGIYNIGLALAELPDALATRVIGGVVFPLYARALQRDSRTFADVYYRSRLAFDALAHGAAGGLIALAPWIVRLLYDARYHDAVPMLQILALRTSIGLLAAPCEVALVAMGMSRYGFQRNLFVAVSTLVAMPIGGFLGGAPGVVWGATVARLAGLVAVWPAARERGILRLRRELLFLPFLGAGWSIGYLLSCVLPTR